MSKSIVIPQPVDGVAATERMREGGNERRGYVGLDRNERVEPLPEWFVEQLRGSIDSDLLTTYPNVDDLHAELVQATGLAPERLLVTPGNDPVIKALFQAYVRPGDTIVTLDPSYAMYRVYARMFGAEAALIGFDRDMQVDLDALLAAIEPGVKLVFIANPNQPTGTVLGDEALRAVVRRAGEVGAVVMADEAYTYFAPDTTALPLVEDHANLLVARSFSKAGFAGVRIGFVAGSPEIVRTLFTVRSAAEVSAVAILAAQLLLAHPEVGSDYGRAVAEGGSLLAERARTLGLEPLPSHGNFMQIRVPEGLDPAAIVEALEERKWLIKGPFRDACLEGCIRVTLGGPELMARFADVLDEVVAELRA
jgi:histidinol-phosphate aminotransferase